MSEPTPVQPPDLAERLRSVRVGLRDDLEVSRHLFRGRPAYVVRDPMTFQSHRLEPADYDLFVSIDARQSLGEIFEDLVRRGRLEQNDEQSFYQFVFSLHRLGFLSLPVADDKILYRRFQARQRAQRRRKTMGFLFLQIPLWNPDEFLNRTMRYVRPLLRRSVFVLWILLIASAGAVVLARWDDLWQPFNGLLAARNLPLMWLLLVTLKVFHEFGHAYVCKHFGGDVPEMGVFLIAGTPCAYVDASASWGFTRRRDRLAVCLAGMYVETAIAAIAAFVWAATGPSLLNALAYNVLFLGSAVTILFNINPLMRFDGYYVFSDLIEVPNLRARATRYVLDVFKRLALGLRAARPPLSRGMKLTLFGFGVSAALYKVVVVVGIASLIAYKLHLIGLLLGGLFVATTAAGLLIRFCRFLWFAEQTASVRPRAIAVSLLVLVGLPVGLGLLPVRSHVRARGVLSAERETVVRADSPGFVRSVALETGMTVAPGDVVVELENDTLAETLLQAEARLAAAEIRRDAYRVDQPALALQEQQRIAGHRAEIRRRRAEFDALSVPTPAGGTVIQCLRGRDTGRYVETGQVLATVVSGAWIVRALLTEDEMTACEPRPGDAVEFRAAGRPERSIAGVIVRVQPAGSRSVNLPALTHEGGGDIVVDSDSRTARPYFEIDIALSAEPNAALRHGMTGYVRLPARPEPVLLHLFRRAIRFYNQFT